MIGHTDTKGYHERLDRKNFKTTVCDKLGLELVDIQMSVIPKWLMQ